MGTIAGVAPAAFGAIAPPPPKPAPPAQDPYGEVDLPTVGGARAPEPEEPSPGSAPPALSELDLPAIPPPRFEQRATSGLELDLPSPAGGRHGDRLDDPGELDLPSSLRPRAAISDLDLPSPAGSGPALAESAFEFDLPSPSFGDLPSPAQRDLPSPARGDLPSPAQGNLPSPAQGNLPSPAQGNLPVTSAGNLPSPAPNLPVRAAGGVGLPAPGNLPELARSAPPDPSFAATDLPPSSSIPPPLDELGGGAAGFGELDLPPLVLSRVPPPPAATLDGTVRSPGVEPPPGGGVQRQAGGGVQYGEVNLESIPPAAPPVGEDAAEPLAVAAQPRSAAPSLLDSGTGLPPATHKQTPESVPKARRSGRGLKIAAGAVAVLAVSGGALALVPAIGPFGAYWVSDQLKRGEYEQLAREVVGKARDRLRADTQTAARDGLALAQREQARAPRARSLAAYVAFLGYLQELRFGNDTARRARAQVALDELSALADDEVAHLGLARAARAAVQGQLARARQGARAVLAADPSNVDALVLDGEIELRARDSKAALSAWQRAAKVERGARTSFGLARASYAARDLETARRHAAAALEAEPEHVGSRVLLAEISWRNERDEKKTLELLDEVLKRARAASSDELVRGYTILGDVNLARSRISRAEGAYGAALKVDPRAGRALSGLGEALFRAGRYSEALARFEAGAQADPDDLTTKIGVAKSKLLLERMQDATDMLKKLRELQPKSAAVNYWFGQAREASGDREQAEKAYRAALEAGGDVEALVDSYVALALLQNQLGRAEEAQKLLEEAKTKLGNTVQVYKALGTLATHQQRDAAAIEAYQQALALDPQDVSARFRLGTALRRAKRFDEAQAAFDRVGSVDKDYPGLALERGLLFEASGRSDDALKAYESALAKAPNDIDLMLRVGCGKVMAGRPEQAVGLLRRVLAERPNSAEINHCLGRALLLESKNLAESLRLLERAVEIDPHRAEHHLYVGWAANEAGKVGEAERELTLALKLDQSLGDAYWQRGVLRHRQGAVKDAVEDLRRALELSPGRAEAHAALADSLYDLGRELEAMREWEQAVRAQPDNATWLFRYGKLLAINHKNGEAREHLTRAIEIGDKQDTKPRWSWEAHYLLARAMGSVREAAPHWEEFLRQGPRDSPYRTEAKAALERLGRPWRDN